MPDTAVPSPGPVATSADVLLRNDRNGVATLTLNRAAAYNTLSTSLLAALQTTLDDIAEDANVRVVVIAAAGNVFSVGHDLNEMHAAPDKGPIGALFDQCSRMMQTISRIPQPVIARVQGIAVAAGCQLVAQCDMAIAADTAMFATSGVKLGLFCATPMVAVTRNMPRKKAFEMLMTGDLVDAHEAERLGLINRAVPLAELDSAVDDICQRIVDKSPIAVRRGKELFYRQLEKGLSAAYADASAVITDNMQDMDARAGIEAFLDKRDMPEWTGE